MHIDSYQFGEIVIDGKRYTGDVIVYPDHVQGNWWRKEGHELCLDDIREVLENKPRPPMCIGERGKPETVIVGTGAANCMRVLPETEKHLRSQGIKLTALPTEKAVKTYNQLIIKGEKPGLRSCFGGVGKVIACLHLTC